MSHIELPNIPLALKWAVCVLGDAVDLTPIDARFTYSYSVTSAPVGSSAAFSGAVFTPDVGGAYVLTVTSGGDSRAVNLFAFAASVASGLAPSPAQAPYSAAEVRAILRALTQETPAAQLVAWNAGTVPPGLNIARFGGR